MGRPFKCPFCHTSKSICKGLRRTKQMGVRQIRQCSSCRRKFTPRRQAGSNKTEAADDRP